VSPCLLFAETGPATIQEGDFRITGTLENPRLDEASGIKAVTGGAFFLHNDQKRDVFVIDDGGRNLGAFKLDGSKSKDWEDITLVPGADGPLLVIADTGDNHAKRKDVQLYFFAVPNAGDYQRDHDIVHRLDIRYPGGPRDVEAVAYDPSGERILLMSKREVPPRLFAVPLEDALAREEVIAAELGEVGGIRPPTPLDLISSPKRGPHVSQPTGLDISPDGRTAAVITYRSLYIYHRADGQSWEDAFQGQPDEYTGPPGKHDEAVTFSLDGKAVYVTTERRPAPIYRLELPAVK
jgi:hypothetical protein